MLGIHYLHEDIELGANTKLKKFENMADFPFHSLLQGAKNRVLTKSDFRESSLLLADGKPGLYVSGDKFLVVAHTRGGMSAQDWFNPCHIIHVFKKSKKALGDGLFKKGDG